MSSSGVPPAIHAKRYFFAGLLGLPAVLLGSVCYNFDKVYGRRWRVQKRLGKRLGPVLDVVCRVMFSSSEEVAASSQEQEVSNAELELWVDRSAVLLGVYAVALVSWIISFNVSWRDYSSAWLIRPLSVDDTSGW